jgi:hypothetical protein
MQVDENTRLREQLVDIKHHLRLLSSSPSYTTASAVTIIDRLLEQIDATLNQRLKTFSLVDDVKSTTDEKNA